MGSESPLKRAVCGISRFRGPLSLCDWRGEIGTVPFVPPSLRFYTLPLYRATCDRTWLSEYPLPR